MDEAYRWVSWLPADRVTWRRLVLLRSLIHPVSGRYLWSWRKLEGLFGVTYHTAQSWHAQAIDWIVATANVQA